MPWSSEPHLADGFESIVDCVVLYRRRHPGELDSLDKLSIPQNTFSQLLYK